MRNATSRAVDDMKIAYINSLLHLPKVLVREILQYGTFSLTQFILIMTSCSTSHAVGVYYDEHEATLQLLKSRIGCLQYYLHKHTPSEDLIQFMQTCDALSWHYSSPYEIKTREWLKNLTECVLSRMTLIELKFAAEKFTSFDHGYGSTTLLEVVTDDD